MPLTPRNEVLLRYLTRQVMAASIQVVVVLLAGIVLIRSSRYLESAVRAQLPAEFIVPVILWRLPEFIAQLLPGAFAVGICIALARLRSHSELMAASAAGISLGRLAWLLQGAVLIVMVLTALCSLYLAPLGSSRSHQILSSPAVIGLVQSPALGRPLASGGGVVIYAEHSQREGERTALRDIAVITPSEDGRPPLLVLADSGQIDFNSSNGFRLALHSGVAYQAYADGAFTELHFESFTRSLEDWLHGLRRSMQGKARSTWTLLTDRQLGARVELQRRLALVLLVPALALLALACAGALVPPRIGMGFQWQSLLVVVVYALSLAGIGIWGDAATTAQRSPPLAFWPLSLTIAAAATLALLWQSGVLRRGVRR